MYKKCYFLNQTLDHNQSQDDYGHVPGLLTKTVCMRVTKFLSIKLMSVYTHKVLMAKAFS